MASAIIVRKFGSSDVLNLEKISLKNPKDGEILIRQTAIGVHYHDIYVRSGLYKTLKLPGIPGIEAVGIIEDLGSNVKDFNLGDRIVYINSNYGAYSSHRVLDKNLAVKVPEFISDELMATSFSRTLTVIMLLEQVTQLNSNHTILVTAASGGVGKLMCEWASKVGSTVIGCVSTSEKLKIAEKHGCKHSLTYDQKNFINTIKDFTEGKGVDIVFDSVGLKTFDLSIQSLSKCGHLVNFGQSSGPVNPLLMSTLSEKSLTITRPILFHYLLNKEKYTKMANSVFKSFYGNFLTLPRTHGISLENVSEAHDALESRHGGGSIYLKT